MIEADMSGKEIDRAKAPVIEKTDAILRKVYHWIFQVSFGKIVRLFNNEGGPDKAGIDDAIAFAAIGPVCRRFTALFRNSVAGNQVPDDIEKKDGDQHATDPKNGEEVIGILTGESWEIQNFNQQCRDKNSGQDNGNDKLLSHEFLFFAVNRIY